MSTSIGDVMTLAEAADLVGRHPDSLRKAAQRGRLDARKFSFIWVTTRDDLARWIAESGESRRHNGRSPRR